MSESLDELARREYRRRRRRERGFLRTLRHALRPWITRPLMRLNLALFPTFYLLYMRLRLGDEPGRRSRPRATRSRSARSTTAPSGCSGTRRCSPSPGATPYLGFRPHTLASLSNRRRGDHAPARALRLRRLPRRLERSRFAPAQRRDPRADRAHADDRRRDLRPHRRRLEGSALPLEARRHRDRARLRASRSCWCAPGTSAACGSTPGTARRSRCPSTASTTTCWVPTSRPRTPTPRPVWSASACSSRTT